MKIQSAAPFITPKFVLRYTNDIAEQTYLVSTGQIHNGILLILDVAKQIRYAKRYETAPEALAVLLAAKAVVTNIEGALNGWDVLPVEK